MRKLSLQIATIERIKERTTCNRVIKLIIVKIKMVMRKATQFLLKRT